MLKVLIAEDDLMLADLAEEILVDAGYEVCGIARTVAEAVALAQHHKPDLAVLDLRLARRWSGHRYRSRVVAAWQDRRALCHRQHIAGRADNRRR